jgi:hypothetical protein
MVLGHSALDIVGLEGSSRPDPQVRPMRGFDFFGVRGVLRLMPTLTSTSTLASQAVHY